MDPPAEIPGGKHESPSTLSRTPAAIFVGTVSLSADLRITEVNEVFCLLAGTDRLELKGENLLDLVHFDDRSEFQRRIEALAAGQPETRPREVRILHPAGEPRYTLSSLTYETSAGFYAVFHDITDQQWYEQSLWEAYDFLQSTYDTLPQHIAVLDETGTIVSVNFAWCKLAHRHSFGGITYGVGLNYLDACRHAPANPFLGGPETAEQIGGVLQQQTDQYVGEYAYTENENPRYIEIRVSQFRRGNSRRILLILEDVTDRVLARRFLENAKTDLESSLWDRTAILQRTNKRLRREIKRRRQAEVTLKRANMQLRAVFDTIPGGLYVADIQHTIIDISERMLRLFHLPDKESVIGRKCYEVFRKRKAPCNLCSMPEAIRNGQMVTRLTTPEEEAVLKGSYKVFSNPITDESGVAWGTVECLIDVTDLRNVQRALDEQRSVLSRRVAERTAELTAANIELARAARMKDEFLAGMSHELRTPLNAILPSAEALLDEVYGSLTDIQRRTIRRIEESGKHLLSLINDILDVAKMEAGHLTLEETPVSPVDLARACLGMIQQNATKKGLSVEFQNHAQTDQILADERRLKQILINLLGNAVKFTPPGGHIGLVLESAETEPWFRFIVWDTGVGIDPADRERLFQPFVQLDSSLSRQYDGTGLGLSLVSKLTDLHGGKITLESRVGEGSRFIIAIPRSQPPPGDHY
jgi:PAS domain S-box-containing protein